MRAELVLSLFFFGASALLLRSTDSLKGNSKRVVSKQLTWSF